MATVKNFLTWRFLNVSPSSEWNQEGRTLETLALRNSSRWPIYIIDSADKTKLNYLSEVENVWDSTLWSKDRFFFSSVVVFFFPLLLFSCLSFFSFIFFLFFIFALLSFSFLSQGNTRWKVVIINKLTTLLKFLHCDKKILIP